MIPLADALKKKGYLHDKFVIDAFRAVPRADFLPPEFEAEADADIPLPLGYGYLCAQPSMTAVMIELLEPRPGHHILHVGSGSGWVSGMLAYIVGDQGKVVALESLREMHERSRENLDKHDFIRSGRVECVLSRPEEGYPHAAPFDRILVAANAEEIPQPLKRQLKLGGKMVLPIHNHLCYFENRGGMALYREEYPGFVFIPLMLKAT